MLILQNNIGKRGKKWKAIFLGLQHCPSPHSFYKIDFIVSYNKINYKHISLIMCMPFQILKVASIYSILLCLYFFEFYVVTYLTLFILY